MTTITTAATVTPTASEGSLAAIWAEAVALNSDPSLSDEDADEAFRLERDVLQGRISSPQDAAAKLMAVALSFERGGLRDGGDAEALAEVIQWLSATPAPGAQFLAWERDAALLNLACTEGPPKSDEELDLAMDRAGHVEELIATTPAADLIGARVKASFLLTLREEALDENVRCERTELATIRTLVEVLKAATA